MAKKKPSKQAFPETVYGIVDSAYGEVDLFTRADLAEQLGYTDKPVAVAIYTLVEVKKAQVTEAPIEFLD